MRNLDELNNRLKKFDLPEHRRQVSESHGNLDWLKKHLPKKNTLDAELVRLLNLNPKQLHEPYGN